MLKIVETKIHNEPTDETSGFALGCLASLANIFCSIGIRGHSYRLILGVPPTSRPIPNEDKVRQLENSIRLLPTDALRERLSRAVLVVCGKVIDVKSAQLGKPTRITFHAPDWQEAQVEIHEVIVGRIDRKTRSIIFPRSNDVRWKGAPKFRKGQERIFALRATKLKGWSEEHYTALDSLDVYPMSQLDWITAVLAKSRKEVRRKG